MRTLLLLKWPLSLFYILSPWLFFFIFAKIFSLWRVCLTTPTSSSTGSCSRFNLLLLIYLLKGSKLKPDTFEDNRNKDPDSWTKCPACRWKSQLILCQDFLIAHFLRLTFIHSLMIESHAVDQQKTLVVFQFLRVTRTGALRSFPSILGMMGWHWTSQEVTGVRGNCDPFHWVVDVSYGAWEKNKKT